MTLVCTDDAKLFGFGRSSRWPAVRRAHLKTHPVCIACGGFKFLEVHHVIPLHVDATIELDPDNLVTLCEFPGFNCHLYAGHCGNWQTYWPNIKIKSARTMKRQRRELRIWLECRRKELTKSSRGVVT